MKRIDFENGTITSNILNGAVAPKTASALWQGFMLCMESLPYFYEKSVEPMA